MPWALGTGAPCPSWAYSTCPPYTSLPVPHLETPCPPKASSRDSSFSEAILFMGPSLFSLCLLLVPRAWKHHHLLTSTVLSTRCLKTRNEWAPPVGRIHVENSRFMTSLRSAGALPALGVLCHMAPPHQS